MDQLKVGLAFVWKHRFWFSLGLAAILATLPMFLGIWGTNGLLAAYKRKEAELESSYKSISEYTSGNKPNSKWVEARDQAAGGCEG